MSKSKQRADFMSETQKKAMGNQPRSHQNCKAATGVMRPGKTAKDRSRSGGSDE